MNSLKIVLCAISSKILRSKNQPIPMKDVAVMTHDVAFGV